MRNARAKSLRRLAVWLTAGATDEQKKPTSILRKIVNVMTGKGSGYTREERRTDHAGITRRVYQRVKVAWNNRPHGELPKQFEERMRREWMALGNPDPVEVEKMGGQLT